LNENENKGSTTLGTIYEYWSSSLISVDLKNEEIWAHDICIQWIWIFHKYKKGSWSVRHLTTSRPTT